MRFVCLHVALSGSVRRCRETGLVEGEGFAMDASVIEADGSRIQSVEKRSRGRVGGRATDQPTGAKYPSALDGEHAPTNPERKPKARLLTRRQPGPGAGIRR
jgi:hypothetical protein